MKILALDPATKTGLKEMVENKECKYHNKHGKRDTIAYSAWNCIVQRCTNPNQKYYHNYGGKGITICDEWKKSFIKFYKYASRLPNYSDYRKTKNHSEKISIDRIDNTKGYEPGNIRWIKFKNQVYNRGINKNNSTGYTGISMYKDRFHAKVTMNRKQHHLGYFEKIEDAVIARNNFIKENNLPHKIQKIK